MEFVAALVVSAVFGWLVIYHAVRSAIGDTVARGPTFRLTWIDGDEGGATLELENVGPVPVFEVAVSVQPGDAPVTPVLLEALMVQPAEQVRARVPDAALPPGGTERGGQRVVHLAVRYRPTLDASVRPRSERVPVLVGAPVNGDQGST